MGEVKERWGEGGYEVKGDSEVVGEGGGGGSIRRYSINHQQRKHNSSKILRKYEKNSKTFIFLLTAQFIISQRISVYTYTEFGME